ncbi:hypothetical protein ALC57_10331 [Trachymyrmex cornetzi]|uniref:Uncharacterized protein n=1 Tax=Trachymyrmex cornetzi TaxID=471704 RepID=A0A195DWS0_9HYME|nr:hypothetical protein ALC57_10331 [Trachymyrmex cornetzi]
MDTTNYFHALSSGFSTVQPSFKFVFRASFSTNVYRENYMNKANDTGDYAYICDQQFGHKLRIKLQCLYIRIRVPSHFTARRSRSTGRNWNSCIHVCSLCARRLGTY